MNIATLGQVRIIESWQYYQSELKRVIAPLTEEQLSLRPVPGQRSLGELAAHIVFGRALWLHRVLGQPELAPMLDWDKPEARPRTAAEVVQGLDLTWRILRTCLDDWTAEALRSTVPSDEAERLQVIWGLMEHDMHHGGEFSFVLGTCSLPALDR